MYLVILGWIVQYDVEKLDCLVVSVYEKRQVRNLISDLPLSS